MQGYACFVVVQLRLLLADEDALFDLQHIWMFLATDNFEIIPCNFHPAFLSNMLHWGIDLNSTQWLTCQSRLVCMLFQTFFPISLCRADVAVVAHRTSILVNDARHKRIGNFVFERETRGKSFGAFENNFQFGEGEILTETADKTVLYF